MIAGQSLHFPEVVGELVEALPAGFGWVEQTISTPDGWNRASCRRFLPVVGEEGVVMDVYDTYFPHDNNHDPDNFGAPSLYRGREVIRALPTG